MSAATLLQTQFGAWHPQFGHLAPPAVIVPLPDGFTDYLLEDGLVVGDADDAVGPAHARLHAIATAPAITPPPPAAPRPRAQAPPRRGRQPARRAAPPAQSRQVEPQLRGPRRGATARLGACDW